MKNWVIGGALALLTLVITSSDAPASLASGAPELAGTVNLVAIDADNTNGPPAGGNVRDDIGPVDRCISISNGNSVTVDVVVDSIPAWSSATLTGGAGGISADLEYNRRVLNVTTYDTSTSTRLFYAVPAGTTFEQRDATPDVDGRFRFDSSQIVPFAIDDGEGVLARITLTAVNPGISYLKLTDTVGDLDQPIREPRVLNPAGKPFDITTVQHAMIAVGQACPADPTDADADAIANEADNCPLTKNGAAQAALVGTGNQTDTDADGEGNACQDTDADSSGTASFLCQGMCPGGHFRDSIESFIGTDPVRRCAANATVNNEGLPDRWPLDLNDDQRANTVDVLLYVPVLNSVAPGPPYAVRPDLTANGVVNTLDVLLFVPSLNQTCAPLADAVDTCPGTAGADPVDINGCSADQVDGDGDGICDIDARGTGPGAGCSGNDNCRKAANVAQTDTDADGKGNACDPEGLGPNTDGLAGANDCTDGVDNDGDSLTDAADPVCSDTGDTDGDFFTNGHELYMGTSTTLQCSATAGGNDEAVDAWPADTNDTINVSQADITPVTPYISSSGPVTPYAPRYDMILDGRISMADALIIGYIRFANSTCPGPTH